MQDLPRASCLARAFRTAAGALLAALLVLAASASPAAADPALVAQWGFDEGAGQTALDDGPLRMHGTLGSSGRADGEDPLRIAGALGGGALRFRDGTFVHVQDDRRLDLGTLTVEGVARADSTPGPYRYLVAHGAVGCFSGSYGLYTAKDGGLAFYVFDGERYYVSAAALPADVWNGGWHRVTGTFDGEHVRAFIDGQEVGGGLAVAPGTAIEYLSMPQGTYFGTYVGACRLPFTGDLDSVRFWTGAGTPATVALQAGATAGQPLTPAAAGTVIEAAPPKSTCTVRASRTQIRTKRRVTVVVRAAGAKGPLRRVRLSVRRANARKVLAAPRTNANGTAKLVLKLRSSGRLRIGVVGRASCTPAFIKVSHR